jgi:hypothetical protein
LQLAPGLIDSGGEVLRANHCIRSGHLNGGQCHVSQNQVLIEHQFVIITPWVVVTASDTWSISSGAHASRLAILCNVDT